MNDNNDNVNVESTANVPDTPARTRTAKPAARKPVTVGTVPMRTLGDVFRIAKSVTPDNFTAMVAAYNRDHGITHAARNVGRFSRTRIMDFQNESIHGNAARKLTDVQLLFAWRVEFPAAVGAVFTGTPARGVRIVRDVRTQLFSASANPPHHGAKFTVTGNAGDTRFGPTNIDWPKTT